MKAVFKYRGRMLYDPDIAMIRALVQANPEASRRELSRQLCQRWNWVRS